MTTKPNLKLVPPPDDGKGSAAVAGALANKKANFASRTFFHGDNLAMLRGLNSESVDLIATDPPFNKGKDFHATPDSLAAGASFQDRWTWEADHEKWLGDLTDESDTLRKVIEAAYNGHSESMGAFCCFLAVRLMEMHRVLKPTGSLFIHCDKTAEHYIKAVMDAIFGAGAFLNSITWKRAYSKNGGSRTFPNNTDSILFYAKSPKASGAVKHTFNPQFLPYDASYTGRAYRFTDEEGRRYRLDKLTAAAGNTNPNQTYELMGVTRTWSCVKEKMDELVAQGRVIQTKPGNVPAFKRYLDEGKGVLVDNLWDDIGPVAPAAEEKTGYPTQKPLALYARIIRAASNPGDVVLDPFCGCATTCVAAEQLGRQWIGMDLWPKAAEVMVERAQRECDGLMGGAMTMLSHPPTRTDDGLPAAPELKPRFKQQADIGPRQTREEMMAELTANGENCQCVGCERHFDDVAYLELDHDKPRAEGGRNSIDNRTPLCKTCNGIKGHRNTLSGLQGIILKAARNPKHRWHDWAKKSPYAKRVIRRKQDD